MTTTPESPTGAGPRRTRRVAVLGLAAAGLVCGGAVAAGAATTGSHHASAPAPGPASSLSSGSSSGSSSSGSSSGAPVPARPPARTPHIDGTVTALAGTALMVKDPDGFTREIVLSGTTTYTLDGKAASRSALTTGRFVHAEGTVDANGTSLDASTVAIMTSAPRPGQGPAGLPGRGGPGGPAGPGGAGAPGGSDAPKAGGPTGGTAPSGTAPSGTAPARPAAPSSTGSAHGS